MPKIKRAELPHLGQDWRQYKLPGVHVCQLPDEVQGEGAIIQCVEEVLRMGQWRDCNRLWMATNYRWQRLGGGYVVA